MKFEGPVPTGEELGRYLVELWVWARRVWIEAIWNALWESNLGWMLIGLGVASSVAWIGWRRLKLWWYLGKF